MNYTQILNHVKTGDKQSVKTRELLRDLYSKVDEQYSKQFKKSITGFCFGEIDDIPMGERLSILENRFFGKSIVEVDITHNPDNYDRNRIVVKQDRPDLVSTVEQVLISQNIAYQVKRESE